jgi:hypothetical protein
MPAAFPKQLGNHSQQLVDLLSTYGMDLIMQGYVEQVREWLALLPEDIIWNQLTRACGCDRSLPGAGRPALVTGSAGSRAWMPMRTSIAA